MPTSPIAHGIPGAPNLHNGFILCKKGSQFKYCYSRFKLLPCPNAILIQKPEPLSLHVKANSIFQALCSKHPAFISSNLQVRIGLYTVFIRTRPGGRNMRKRKGWRKEYTSFWELYQGVHKLLGGTNPICTHVQKLLEEPVHLYIVCFNRCN